MPHIDIPVLIVGGGPTGLSTSIMLSRLGVHSLLVEKHPDTAIHPKAVGITTRTMELFRQWGVERRVREASLDVDFVNSIRSTLAGPELNRVTLGYPDEELARTLSPTAPAACAQDLLEPILLSHARNFDGAELCFNTELVSLSQDADGVEATLVDRATNRGRLVRARYVVAADGVWSPVRRKLGIAMKGDGNLGDHLSILFRADLAGVARARLCALYAVRNATVSGILCPTSRDGRWIFATPWSARRPIPDPYTRTAIVRAAVGVPDLLVELLDAGTLSFGAQVAERFREGRVFLVGDAAHRMTPSGGLGMNTAIAAAHNLTWKLAAVLQGWAAPALLHSYEAERRPVGERNVARSIGRMPELTGIAADLGAVYTSCAVSWDDEEGRPAWVKPDVRARAGQRVPHLWIERDGALLSTLDLPERRMTLLATSHGSAWCEAAEAAARAIGVPLDTCVVNARYAFGTDEQLWQAYFGLDARCAVLLRPDGHIAWFTPPTAVDPEVMVASRLAVLLGRVPAPCAERRPAASITAEQRARRAYTSPTWRRSRRTSIQ